MLLTGYRQHTQMQCSALSQIPFQIPFKNVVEQAFSLLQNSIRTTGKSSLCFGTDFCLVFTLLTLSQPLIITLKTFLIDFIHMLFAAFLNILLNINQLDVAF